MLFNFSTTESVCFVCNLLSSV